MMGKLPDTGYIHKIIKQLQPADLSFMLTFIEVSWCSPPGVNVFQDLTISAFEDLFYEYIKPSFLTEVSMNGNKSLHLQI